MHICKNAPRLRAKQPAVHVTIPRDNTYAKEPSDLSPLYNGEASALPARSSVTSSGTGAYAGHAGPPLT